MMRYALTVRLLAVSVGLMTSAGTVAAPGHADTTANSFLAALNNAGVAYDDPAGTVALGQSICPMLVQPGGSLASVASSVSGTNGMSPDAAGLFTSVAMAMFCPATISSLTTGNSRIPLRIPGF